MTLSPNYISVFFVVEDFFSDEQLSVYLGLFRKLADDTSTSKNAVLLSSIRPLIAALENQLTA